MFYNLRLSARWVYWLCIAAFFGFGVSRLPSWYGYIGVPFIYADYPVDDVVIAWVGAVIFPLLLFFLENRIV